MSSADDIYKGHQVTFDHAQTGLRKDKIMKLDLLDAQAKVLSPFPNAAKLGV
jgi:hypothetical protein